jgi:capsular polysaccharide biosynthesis protein/predicted Ser/Thr protein kinase
MSDIIKGKCPTCGRESGGQSAGEICPKCAAAMLGDEPTACSDQTCEKPAFEPPAVAELAPLFPSLEISGLIGRGGMGAVYQARQKELDRPVALKILPPDIGSTPGFAERFVREAKAMARLNHPGVVTIYDFGKAGDLYYLLMEFVDGVNLRQLMQQRRLSPREALAIVPQICDALQYAHDQGIVHRDIKPENILLDRRGRVKVADFGLAKLIQEGSELSSVLGKTEGSTFMTEAGKIIGTPAYMAPEQAEHPESVDHRADIYAVGLVFYQMLTGELPGKPFEPPSRKVHLDVRLDEVVLQALEKDPQRRYQQASHLKTAVENTSKVSEQQESEPVESKKPAPPGWQMYVAGFLSLGFLELGILALGDRDSLYLGIPLMLVVLMLFILIRRRWLTGFLMGLTVALCIWFGFAGPLMHSFAVTIAGFATGSFLFVKCCKRTSDHQRFFIAFVIVFTLTVGCSALVSHMLPNSYQAVVRLAFLGDPEPDVNVSLETQRIKSEEILGRVVDELNLDQFWPSYGSGMGRIKALQVLRHSVSIRAVTRALPTNPPLLEIIAFSGNPINAADLANAIADAYKKADYSTVPANRHLDIIDRAIPAERPIKPNRPLNLMIGAVLGLLLGTIGGALNDRRGKRAHRQ